MSHPRDHRHRGINRGALPGFSILEFHLELKIEQQFVTVDIKKFFCGLCISSMGGAYSIEKNQSRTV